MLWYFEQENVGFTKLIIDLDKSEKFIVLWEQSHQHDAFFNPFSKFPGNSRVLCKKIMKFQELSKNRKFSNKGAGHIGKDIPF